MKKFASIFLSTALVYKLSSLIVSGVLEGGGGIEASINGDRRYDLLLFGAIVCDTIWKARNLAIFKDMVSNPYKLC